MSSSTSLTVRHSRGLRLRFTSRRGGTVPFTDRHAKTCSHNSCRGGTGRGDAVGSRLGDTDQQSRRTQSRRRNAQRCRTGGPCVRPLALLAHLPLLPAFLSSLLPAVLALASLLRLSINRPVLSREGARSAARDQTLGRHPALGSTLGGRAARRPYCGADRQQDSGGGLRHARRSHPQTATSNTNEPTTQPTSAPHNRTNIAARLARSTSSISWRPAW